jgi:hypothetical protein
VASILSPNPRLKQRRQATQIVRHRTTAPPPFVDDSGEVRPRLPSCSRP